MISIIEHFSGKNGTLRWSILVGKQKHSKMIKPKTLLINGKRAIPTCAPMIDSHSLLHNKTLKNT